MHAVKLARNSSLNTHPMTPTAPPTHGRHMPALDGLRGLAVGLVLFQHFFHGVDKGPAFADSVVFGLASRSWMGVDLFFVLSGFLITGILWDQKGSERYFKNFYARRALRIFPAYYALLALAYFGLPLLGHPAAQEFIADSRADQLWHWSYLSNFRIAWLGEWYHHHVPNVFWSLAIEEQFYLCWPLVVAACSRRALVLLSVLLFVLALGLRMALALDPDVTWVSSFVLTPTRMDGLVLGALLAMLLRSGISLGRSRRGAWIVAALTSVPLIALSLQRSEGWRDLPVQSLRFSLVALGFGALLWLSVTGDEQSRLQRIFRCRPLRFLGKYSYALYLWHGPMDFLARQLYDPNQAELMAGSRLPAQALFVLLATSLSIAASLLSWFLIEKHFMKLKGPFEPRATSA